MFNDTHGVVYQYFWLEAYGIIIKIYSLLLLLHIMDEHKHKILVTLIFTMAMYQVTAQVVALQSVAIEQHWSMMKVLLFSMEFVDVASKVYNMWRYEKVVRYMKNQLLGSFSKMMFWQWTRLSYDTFRSLIRVVSKSWPKKHTWKKTSLLELE